jgi:hypothetical protein
MGGWSKRVERVKSEDVKKTLAISELPIDELIDYGKQLGLELNAKMGHGELLRRVRERQELLIELDKDALLDIVVWARRPVRQSASKEQLAKEIAAVKKMDFAQLSDRGLRALAGWLPGRRSRRPCGSANLSGTWCAASVGKCWARSSAR